MQLLHKAAKETPSPQDFRKDAHRAMAPVEKPHTELSAEAKTEEPLLDLEHIPDNTETSE